MAADEGSDRNQDRAPVVIGVCILLIIVSLVATGLRLYARHLVRLKLWWDDWFCLIGLVRIHTKKTYWYEPKKRVQNANFIAITCSLSHFYQ
jgi:hypothetical protein